MEPKTIPVYITHGVPLIWTAKDACTLREEYRIVGCLVGCLPGAPRQGVHLSLPLRLSKEEATLLQHKGIAQLLNGSKPMEKPTEDDVEVFNQQRKLLYEEQDKLSREHRKQEMHQHMDQILEGKKEKKRKQLLKRKAAGDDITEEEIANPTVSVDLDKLVVKPLPEQYQFIQICAATAGPHEGSPAVWDFPHSDQERLRYAVFRDLWEQGYFLTSGSKFGGDFLVYPGDPARFHAMYIAICVPYKKNLDATEVTSWSRMGTNVKKTILLCSLRDSERVQYTSLQWTGIS